MAVRKKWEKRDLHLAARIKTYRQKQGYSINKLAELANIPVTTLCNIENGKSTPSIFALDSLSKNFGVSMEYLYRGTAVDNQYTK